MHLTYLPPPPGVDIQDPCILQNVVIPIHSSGDQQLRVLLSIVEAASSMGGSLHWPRSFLGLLQFSPFLGQVTQYTYTIITLNKALSNNFVESTVMTA